MYKYKRIFLVEDDVDDTEFFREVVKELNSGLSCVTALNGIEGLEKLTSGVMPDLIFTDINMPLMNGLQFLEKLNSEFRFSQIPKVMLTTSDSPLDKKKASELGAARYIVKPANFFNLRKTIHELLLKGV